MCCGTFWASRVVVIVVGAGVVEVAVECCEGSRGWWRAEAVKAGNTSPGAEDEEIEIVGLSGWLCTVDVAGRSS